MIYKIKNYKLLLFVGLAGWAATAVAHDEVSSPRLKGEQDRSFVKTSLVSKKSTRCSPKGELKVLFKLHNQMRRKGRRCVNKRNSKAKKLKYSCELSKASLLHAKDMAHNNYLNHVSLDGRTIGDRATQSDYQWRKVGENIAEGFESARAVHDAWAGSTGHCQNIMNAAYRDMGAAKVGKSWVVMFGGQ